MRADCIMQRYICQTIDQRTVLEHDAAHWILQRNAQTYGVCKFEEDRSSICNSISYLHDLGLQIAHVLGGWSSLCLRHAQPQP